MEKRKSKRQSIKEIEDKLTEMAECFEQHDRKKKAKEELDAIADEASGLAFDNIKFIVEDYPDFDHILFRVEIPGQLVVKFCVNPENLKGNKKAIKLLAKEFYRWSKGAKEIEW